MRRIKITPKLLKKAENFNDDIFDQRGNGFEKPLVRLKKLKSSISSSKHKKYVQHIIDRYSYILNATPTEMEVLINEFNTIIPTYAVKESIKKGEIEFYKQIVIALRYEALRDKEFPKFLLSSDIKSCVYCNAQPTLTIELIHYDKKKKKIKEAKSKLQLDHFYPKSKYPFLATSFFNLYPTCANCNLAKGVKEAKFKLYTSTDDLEEFLFKIDDKSIIEYWTKMELSKIKIEFQSKNRDDNLLKNHQELFKIQEIYESNKDIAEELIIKAKANPDSYRKMLSKSFTRIFPDESFVDRILIGNYSKPEETFKRPYAKYSQDIARQLRLIK